jgi:hypothetical protein
MKSAPLSSSRRRLSLNETLARPGPPWLPKGVLSGEVAPPIHRPPATGSSSGLFWADSLHPRTRPLTRYSANDERNGEKMSIWIKRAAALWQAQSRSRKISIIVGGVAAIAVLLVFSPFAASEEERLKEAVKETIREAAFDPDSVQFRNVVLKPSFQRSIICGEYNAKNRLGGYVGYKPFVFNGPELGVLTMVTDEQYEQWCTRRR